MTTGNRESNPGYNDVPPELFNILDVAMRTEVQILLSDSSSEGHLASERTADFAKTDEPYDGWEWLFTRGHRVAYNVRRYYGSDSWRESLGMPDISLDKDLFVTDRAAAAGLLEMLMWTRVAVVPTGVEKHPYIAEREGVYGEFLEMQKELTGEDIFPEPNKFLFPGITWADVINAMLTGEVRVGPKP